MDDRVIHFRRGLPGFLSYTRWRLYAEAPPFYVLEAVEAPAVALPVASPYAFYPDYAFTLPEDVARRLGPLESPEDVVVLAVVTVRMPKEASTINLRAPVVVHARTLLGEQIVLEGVPYSTRMPLFPNRPAPAGKDR
ncbi:MAG: flagellar assembly protein FliW [Hydrogenibacillus sp.]|nr:flagellar assembly protein FliW [Hydrogenibacillus sp.]